jgi:hypothetical protein
MELFLRKPARNRAYSLTTPLLRAGFRIGHTQLKTAIERGVEIFAEAYRRDVWINQNDYVEIWLEKDALAGVVYGVTEEFDVPLMVSRGYSSLSYLHGAAMQIDDIDKPTLFGRCPLPVACVYPVSPHVRYCVGSIVRRFLSS